MKKNILRSALSVLLTVSLLLMSVMTGLVAAADTTEHLVTVDTVEVGATSVTVHCGATGAKDWIHIFPANYTSSSQNLGNYKYCTANGDVVYNLTAPIVAGDYVVVMYLNDGYTEGDRFDFTVEPIHTGAILEKEVYNGLEPIVVDWTAVPEECGWAAVYPADYDGALTEYGDYIMRGTASFPSGTSSRYKTLTWPLATGDYKIVFFTGSNYTVNTTVEFSVNAPTVSVDKPVVYVNHAETVTLSVTGGLTPNKWHRVRLYKANAGYTVDDSNFGSFGVHFVNDNLIGDASGITTNADGAGSAAETLHNKITEPGIYAYCIMEEWNTKAVIFIEVKAAATVSLSRTSLPLGANVPLMLKATAGDLGLEPNKTYNVRLYGAWNGVSGFGSSEVNWNAYVGDGAALKTDENGAGSVLETLHVKNISATGNYAYCIQDGFDTKARVFFNATEAVTELGDDVPQVKLNKNIYALGNGEALTLSVLNSVEVGLTAGKYYYVRLYKAKSGFGVADSGYGNSGVDFGSKIGSDDGITLDEDGNASRAYSLHTEITEPGIYAYVVMNGWDTVARAFFEVTQPAGDVNMDGEINILDLIRLKKIIAEESDETAGADVNLDEGVDIFDLMDLRTLLLSR